MSARAAETLAAFAVATEVEALPRRVRQRAALHFMDTLGAGSPRWERPRCHALDLRAGARSATSSSRTRRTGLALSAAA